jgi:decaprenyl-phosphate phosphoribosyltransferase
MGRLTSTTRHTDSSKDWAHSLSTSVQTKIETQVVSANTAPTSARLKAHLCIARFDHSIKNVFILPGIILPLSILREPVTPTLIKRLGLGFLAATLIACSNYVLNEVLDAPFDKKHPLKCIRPAARGLINIPAAYFQWLLMMIAGIAIACILSWQFALAAAGLWIMGCLYNIPPFRTKDILYLDVLTEAINNPLRMLLGWYMVTSTLVPPVSLIVSYWMLGCYFMALKRFSEYREIGSPLMAGAYRKSFLRYTERSLLGSVLFYASVAMLMFGAFIMRYRMELILAVPFVALLMAMYFDLAFHPNSAVQHPEKLYRQPALMATTIITSTVFIALLYCNIPWIGRFFSPTLPQAHMVKVTSR